MVYSLTDPNYVWREFGVTAALQQNLLQNVKIEEYNSPSVLREQIKKNSLEGSGRWKIVQSYEDSIGISIGVSMARSRKMSESNNFQLLSQLKQSSLLGSYMNSRLADPQPVMESTRLMLASSIGAQRKQIKLTLDGF